MQGLMVVEIYVIAQKGLRTRVEGRDSAHFREATARYR
jgi:hypothetical protein